MTRRERRLLEEQGVLPEVSVAEPAPVAPEPAPLVTPAQPAAPMTRRERKMLEETGVIPIPPEYQQPAESSALQDTSLVEVTQTAPVPAPLGPPEPLPPVFGLPPVEAPTVEAPSETPPAPAPGPVPEQSAPAPAPAPADTIFPSRVVGDVTMATSSLILPTTPMVDMTGPVGDTGEIIVTGQITLPNRVSETGTIPSMREDRDDEERFDAYVTGELAAMAQPIRAAKAVSGQGDDTDILLVRRVRWGTAAILTATGAAVLGIGAIALLIIALLTDTLV
ncbi:MAG TPA: hypothetical protein VGP34_00180 [Pontimonas sp.]|nr:hypothetical protein [Pontimonas sp.]